ncbi:DUF4283 domain-containing protein [Raphanus sativus]|nr:DUF4283 domain-containing protein [Raphanus sativus]
MFHTAQWTSEHSMSTPPLKAIRIWAHLTGVPLDLRYNKGLSLVAGLIGEPKETDDFTKNLVSLTVSHVKVEVDLTQPLPDVVEFQRQSGEVVEVQKDPLKKPFSSPEIPKPSLKRSRSSPTFSPTPVTNRPPVLPLNSDPLQSLLFSANPFAILSSDPQNPPLPQNCPSSAVLPVPCSLSEDPPALS